MCVSLVTSRFLRGDILNEASHTNISLIVDEKHTLEEAVFEMKSVHWLSKHSTFSLKHFPPWDRL